MKVFKIILILVLLVSASISVCSNYNQPLTQGEISDWQKSYGQIGKTKSDITWQPKTLESWFEHLTLDEKVEIYNWWKEKYLPENCDWTFIWNPDWETRMFDDETGIFYIETPKGKWFIKMEKMVDWRENCIEIFPEIEDVPLYRLDK